jgi:hypothetical protein
MSGRPDNVGFLTVLSLLAAYHPKSVDCLTVLSLLTALLMLTDWMSMRSELKTCPSGDSFTGLHFILKSIQLKVKTDILRKLPNLYMYMVGGNILTFLRK